MIVNFPAINTGVDSNASTVGQLYREGRMHDAFVEAQQFLENEPSNAEAFLMLSATAQCLGHVELSARAVLLGLKTCPDNLALKLLATFNNVASGGFRENSDFVADIISRDLSIEEPIFQFLQRILKGQESHAILNYVVADTPVHWSISRDPAVVANFAGLYQWMPIFHNSVQNVDAFYRQYARYAQFNDARNDRQQSYLCDRIQVFDSMKMLDAGCGSGTLLRALRQKANIECFGVDVSAEAGPYFLANNPTATFWAGDMINLPFESDFFDTIVTTDTLEHALKPYHAIKELNRVVKPGGIIAISVPDGRLDYYIGHINFFSGQALQSMLEEFGYVSIEYYTDGILATLTTHRR